MKETHYNLPTSTFAIVKDVLKYANIDLFEWDLKSDIITWGGVLFGEDAAHNVNTLQFDDFLKMVHPEDNARIRDELAGAKEAKSPFITELSIITPEGEHKYYRIYAHYVKDKYVGLLWDATESEKDKQWLDRIYTGLIKIGGQSFFTDLAIFLAENFQVKAVMIGKYLKGMNQIETLAFVHENSIMENITYSIKDYPCGRVIKEGLQIYSTDIQESYPTDRFKQMNIHGYVGIPLNDVEGKPIGLIALLHDNVISNSDDFEYLLPIFASRTSAELQRQLSIDILNKSQKQFKDVFDHSSVPVFLMDGNSKIISCNVALETTLGYTSDKLQRFSLIDLMHPDDWIDSEIFFPSVMNAGTEGFRMESRLKHKDGHYLWTEAFISAVVDSSDKLLYIIIMVQDITEKKQAQDALIESERKLTEAQQIAGLGRWEWDLINDYSYWSDIIYEIFGIDKSHKIITRDLFKSLLSEEGRENFSAKLENFVSLGKWNIQIKIIRPDGKEKYVKILGRVEKDENGIPVRAIGTIQDITELYFARIEIEQKSHDLTLINDVNSIINEPGKLENVYARLSHWFFEQFSCTGFVISYTDESKNSLSIDYLDFKGPISQIMEEKKNYSFKPIELSFHNKGIHSNIFLDKRPQFKTIDYLREAVTKDVVKNPGSLTSEDVIDIILDEDMEEYLRHISIFPLVADDNVLALFHIFNREALTQNDIGRINAICQQIAGIIRRKRAVDGLILHREKLIQLSRKLFHVQEEERRRIALELHDDLGQSLTAMRINLSKVLSTLDGKIDNHVLEKLTDTINIIDNSEESIRDISLMLRPSMLDELGLLSSLEWYVGHYRKRNDILVNLNFLIPNERLQSDQQIVLYRIIQEALTNIARHANAKNVDINIQRKDGNILTIIKDNGNGFDYQAVTQTGSLKKSAGLFGMRERIQLVNGGIYIKTKPGDGTEIQITIPIEE